MWIPLFGTYIILLTGVPSLSSIVSTAASLLDASNNVAKLETTPRHGGCPK